MTAGSLIETAIEDRGDVGRIARVTVNNPERRNALGNAGKRALADAMAALGADSGLRVVVLTGAGDRAFIGGADIKEMAGFERHDRAAAEGPALTHRACAAIRALPVPVIARINGHCFGAGLELAASCDMRAAADHAQFGMPEVLYGIPSGMEACLLPQLIGWGKTRELVFTGRRILAGEALQCRLIERVVAAAELDAAVEQWVAAILSAGPNAIRAQKALVAEWERLSIEEAVEAGIRAVAAAHGSDEAKRLMGAFLARRQVRS